MDRFRQFYSRVSLGQANLLLDYNTKIPNPPLHRSITSPVIRMPYLLPGRATHLQVYTLERGLLA